jgi:AraC-like DNA-binding protein
MEAACTVPVTSSVRLVWPFLDLAERKGRDTGFVRERLGLTEVQLRDPDMRVSQQLVAELLQEAVHRSGERDLGLLAARGFESAHFGIDEYLARTRPTLRTALENSGRYLPLLLDGASCTFHVDGNSAYLRLRLHPVLGQFEAAYEFALAVGVLRSRRITGVETLAPREVHFTHPRPASIARHEALFGCPVRFAAPIVQVIIPIEQLELRMPQAEPALRELLERQANAMLERLPHATSYSAQVQALASGELQESSAERVARRLGMSERTLHRKLAAESTSYRDIIEQARKRAALRYLAQERPIEQIAFSLGYASAQSFQRAFRRWTGTTPGAYQRRLRATGS